MIEWKNYFDKIYCIHYYKFEDRMKRMVLELERVGIMHNPIFDWWYDYDSPFFKIIQKNSLAHEVNVEICNDKAFNYFKCSFSHYRIWKEIVARKINKTLILEDDEVFLKDLNFINKILLEFNTINVDLCLFDKFNCVGLNQYMQNLYNMNFYATPHIRYFDNTLQLCSGGCYFLTYNTAKRFVAMYEDKIIQCDNIWNVDSKLTSDLLKAFSIINICCQQPYDNTNCANVDFNLAYKFVLLDKSLYNI